MTMWRRQRRKQRKQRKQKRETMIVELTDESMPLGHHKAH
jgi:hypothetical protein